jgi:glycosyltransferase involved in cell wall biosynthesis
MSDEVDDEKLDAKHLQRPLVSMLLIAYRQEHVIADAVRGALAQTYTPLEILISDDCSPDRTFDLIQQAVSGYTGPHRIVLNRNERNEGIAAHLSKLALMSRGDLLVVAAGDDISVPERCSRLVDVWFAHDRKPDLIASDLLELNAGAGNQARLSPTDLGSYRSIDDWLAHRPHLIGAAHAWSRRLFERFGAMMRGTMAEDQIMTFRAIMSGGAISLREPLVMYRRGGLSGKRRSKSVDEFIARVRQTNQFALAEVAQLLQDAETAGVYARMLDALAAKQARENYTRDVFAADRLSTQIGLMAKANRVKLGFRIRMFLYAACPAIYVPFFALKRWRAPKKSS